MKHFLEASGYIHEVGNISFKKEVSDNNKDEVLLEFFESGTWGHIDDIDIIEVGEDGKRKDIESFKKGKWVSV